MYVSDLIFFHLTYELSQITGRGVVQRKGGYNQAAVFGFECNMEVLCMRGVCMGKMEV